MRIRIEEDDVKLRVLGCSGAEFPGHNPSAFLLDDCLLLDAGTIGAVLEEEEQWQLNDILITHPHLDHIRGIPALADNIIITGQSKNVNVISTNEVITAISTHLMNGMIWPDFTKIPSEAAPVISYTEIVPEREFFVGEFAVTACPVNHTVPAVGYRVSKGGSTIVYTGDTGPTDRIWELADEISALLVEVSFPSEMEELALLTGHLTPKLLATELAKLPKLPPRILITHLKPQYYDRIMAELEALPIPGIELLCEGQVHEI
jgi:ribonuclease BN (tRNA processing enzyme)